MCACPIRVTINLSSLHLCGGNCDCGCEQRPECRSVGYVVLRVDVGWICFFVLSECTPPIRVCSCGCALSLRAVLMTLRGAPISLSGGVTTRAIARG